MTPIISSCLCFPSSDPGWDCRARDQDLPTARRRLWRGWGVQRADQGPEGERPPDAPACMNSGRNSKSDVWPYVSVSGQHSFCCDWLQPIDWGERKEDPRASVPLGSGRSGEPRTQWLPQTAHHACVSVRTNGCWWVFAKIWTPVSPGAVLCRPLVSKYLIACFSLCRTHMQDLQEVTQDLHYENFRSERLKRTGRWATNVSHTYLR